jgi:hypothetical protein
MLLFNHKKPKLCDVFPWIQKFAWIFILLLAARIITGQDPENSTGLVTDRPDRTESSSIVPRNAIQVEAGFYYTSVSDSDMEERETGYIDALIRFGLLERLELRLGLTAASIERKEHGVNDNPAIISGIAPLKPGLKIFITEEDGWIPEIALLTHLYIPFKASGITQSNISSDILLAASHTLSGKVSLGYNIGIEWPGDELNPMGIYSIASGIGITENIGAFVETFGRFQYELFECSMDGGFTFLVLPNLQLDISFAYGLTNTAPDYYAGGGISLRIPQ